MKKILITPNGLRSLSRRFLVGCLLANLAPAVYSQVLTHRYSFDPPSDSQTVTDTVGAANGVFLGAGTFTDSGKLSLDGVDGCVDFGPGLIGGYTSLTLETWADFRTNVLVP